MKVGDLVVSKAHEKFANVVPARLVVRVSNRSLDVANDASWIMLEEDPEDWKPAYNFFVVSSA